MKKYLVVKIGYEYNDEGYDIHDSYQPDTLYSTLEKAREVVSVKNKQALSETARYFDMNSLLQFCTESEVEDLRQHVRANYPSAVSMQKPYYGNGPKREVIEWDDVPTTIFAAATVYPSFYKVLEIEEVE